MLSKIVKKSYKSEKSNIAIATFKKMYNLKEHQKLFHVLRAPIIFSSSVCSKLVVSLTRTKTSIDVHLEREIERERENERERDREREREREKDRERDGDREIKREKV